MMPAFTKISFDKGILAFAVVICPFLLAGVLSADAAADVWMFRRSYYSHAVPPAVAADYPVPTSRSAYRRAMVGTQPGFAIRGGYRYNRIFMRSGNSTDVTIIREDWYNLRP